MEYKKAEPKNFSFEIDDTYYIEQVTKSVQSLLDRPNIMPDQKTSIKRALLGLRRLPLRTAGLDIHIALVDKFNNSATSYDLYLSSDRFATESGGYSNFGFGTDSFSGNTLEVEYGLRDYTGFHIFQESWHTIFHEMTAAELYIYDASADNLLDWGHPDGSIFWKWINNQDGN